MEASLRNDGFPNMVRNTLSKVEISTTALQRLEDVLAQQQNFQQIWQMIRLS